MNLHEYQAKALFAEYGLPVSKGQAVDSPEQAAAAAADIGGDRWVVKAQVHAGGTSCMQIFHEDIMKHAGNKIHRSRPCLGSAGVLS